MSYIRFDDEDVIVSAESIAAPLWSESTLTLTSFYTSSTQVAAGSGDYYFDVYNKVTSDTSAEVQFSIAYADKLGSGSVQYESSVAGKSPTSAIYGQYRSLVLGDEESAFTFGSVTSSYFYVIAVDRARYKEKLLPGTLDLTLTAAGNTVNITDNSQVVSTVSYVDSGRVYELVSGSLGTVNTSVNANGYTGNSGSYGKFLPDIGVIILNGEALATTSGDGGIALSPTGSSSTDDQTPGLIYNALEAGGNFRLSSEETVSSNYIFVRARNSQLNYSSNPSNITGSGELRHDVMIDSPQAYITTVGLYNDNNDLLAVAKLSRPLLKDFTKEALIRIKLDY